MKYQGKPAEISAEQKSRETVKIELQPPVAAIIVHYGFSLSCRVVAVLRSENDYLEKHFLLYLDESFKINDDSCAAALSDRVLNPMIILGGAQMTTDDFILSLGAADNEKKDEYRRFDKPRPDATGNSLGLHLEFKRATAVHKNYD